MVAALAICQLASAGALLLDRRIFIRSVHEAEALDKSAGLAGLVRAAPPELAADVLRFASTEAFEAQLTATLSPARGPQDPRLTADLRARMRDTGMAVTGVYIAREEIHPRLVVDAQPRASNSVVMDRGPPGGGGPPRGLSAARSQPAQSIEAVVEVRPGRWLRMRTRLPPERPLSVAYWGFIPVTLMTVAGAAIWAAGRVARPLRRVAVAAETFAPGAPPPPIPVSGPPDVRRFIQAYNDMSQRLASAFEVQRAMLLAVGHDLRTPIASLRVRAEFVKDAELRARICATLEDMEALTRSALAAAADAFEGQTTRRIDLSALAESLCDDLAETGTTVRFVPGEAVEANARSHEIRRALRNLVDNAVRYGGSAEVRVTAEGSLACLAVEDHGPGIPEGDLERVLQPFTRLESSRARHTGGSGLGLSIAETIARGHGGRLQLTNRPTGGLRVVLTFPALADTL